MKKVLLIIAGLGVWSASLFASESKFEFASTNSYNNADSKEQSNNNKTSLYVEFIKEIQKKLSPLYEQLSPLYEQNRSLGEEYCVLRSEEYDTLQEMIPLVKEKDDLLKKENRLMWGNDANFSSYDEYMQEKRASLNKMDEVVQKLRGIQNDKDNLTQKMLAHRKQLNDIRQKVHDLEAKKKELVEKEWDQFLTEVIEPAFLHYVECPSELNVNIRELERKIMRAMHGWHLCIRQLADTVIHHNGKTPIDLALEANDDRTIEYLLGSAKEGVRPDLLEKINKNGTEAMKKAASAHWKKFDPSLLAHVARFQDNNRILSELVIKPALFNHLVLPVAVVSRNICIAIGGSILGLFK